MKDFRQMVDTYVLDREKHKKYLAFVLALSMMVTFAVPLSLMQPAESMTANREFLGMPLAKANSVTSYIGNNTTDDVTLLIGENHPLRDGATTTEEVIANADREYALGIASQFCVFLSDNFTEKGSDAEGRVAIGGDIIIQDEYLSYSIGKGDFDGKTPLESLIGTTGFAHIITEGEVTSGQLDDTYFENGKNCGSDDYNNGGAEATRKNKLMVLNYNTLQQDYSFNTFIKDNKSVECIPNSSVSKFWQKVDKTQIYVTKLIDFNEQFQMLTERSQKIANIDAKGIVRREPSQNTVILDASAYGQTAECVYFNLTETEWENIKNSKIISFENIPLLPDGPRQVVNNDGTTSEWQFAYIVVSVAGETIYLSDRHNAQGLKLTKINGVYASANSDSGRANNQPGVTSLLYNFPQATTLYLGNNYQGTVLAPNAEVKDCPEGTPGHLSGALIAKSFEGKTEFGYRPYTGPISILGSTSGYTIPVDKFESDGLTPLPGAAFKLTITDQDDNVVTSWTSGDSTEYVTIPTSVNYDGYPESEKPEIGTPIPTVTYTVQEERAPEGYVKTNDVYTIEVTETIQDYFQNEQQYIPSVVDVVVNVKDPDGVLVFNTEFTVTDSYDTEDQKQTRRKIAYSDNTFILQMQNGNIDHVDLLNGEERIETTSVGTSYLISETKPTETTIWKNSETVVTRESSTALIVTQSTQPTESTESTETIETTETSEENQSSESIVQTETTIVKTGTYEEVIQTSIQVNSETMVTTSVVTSYDVESSFTTYNGSTILNSDQVKTTGTVTVDNQTETKTYHFSPDSLMLMELPFKNLTFTNDYGLLFEKTDGTNRLTGADIRLQYASDWDEPFTDVSADDWTWNSSNVTIDVRALAVKYPGMVFRFHEETPPVGYEPADDIYFEMDDTTLRWSSDKATWQTQDITEGYATITMEDQKIHGAKLKLYKSDADNENKYLDGAVFSLYRDGVAEPIKTGITIADGEVGLDFYETFKNDPETAFIKNGYLVPGTYYLLETSTPDGYDNAHNKNHAYYFTIKDNYSVAVGKPDSIPIKIHTQTANQQYFVCDDDDKKMDWNDWGNGSPGFENVKSIRIKATPKFKIYTNIKNQFGLDGNGGKSFDSSEGIIQFDTPQNLAKLEIQCSSWDDKDLQEILLVEIQTSDGKKYVYQAPGTSGGESGSTEAEPDTEETTTTTTAAPGSEAGVNVPITLNVRSAGNQYFACDENGKALDNGNGSLTGIVSIEVVTNVNPKIFTNVSLIDGQQNSTTNKYTFNEPTTITKFEVQTPSWDNTYLEVNSIVFTTQSGKTYTYTAPVTKSKQFTLDQVNVNYPKNLDGYDKTYQFSVSDLNLTDSQGKAITQLSGFDMEFTDGIARKVVSNHQNATTWPWMQFDNVTSVSVTDTILTVQFGLTNPITDLSTIKFTAHWQEEAEAASTLTLRTTANTEKAAAAESEEASESLEIREPTTVGDRIILNIPNKFSSDFDISVTKNWDVKGNTAFIPDELALTLQRKVEGGEWQDYTHAVTVEKTTATMWTYKYAGLPIADDDGKPYYYRVRENTVPAGYTLTYNDDAENGVCKTDTSKNMQITNTLETTSHKVTKTWDKQEVTVDLPDSIQVTLQQSSNGGTTWSDFKTVTITPDNGKWEYTFEDLPAEGMSYRAHEASLSGWEANHDWSNADSTAITNTYKTGGLRIKKEWDGDNESNRPDKITVKLYRKAVAGNNVTPTEPTDADGKYDQTADYSRLLQYSLYFYDANMCGTEVESNSAVSWRNEANCHTSDNKDGVDYTGGFHDAGDHAMFGLPQGFTASTLGWSYYEFKDSFDSLGQTTHYKLIMDEFCDFFVKSTTIENGEVSKFLYQKGNGNTDHGYWGPPEDQLRGSDQMYVTSNSASDIAAEYAAALALHILNFPEDHPNVASGEDEYLKCAEALYRFSTRYNAIESNGPSGFYYEGNNGTYTDDQAWAAAWLYLVTNNNSYKQDCQTKLGQSSISSDRGHYWGNATLATAIVNAAYLGGSWDSVINFHGTWDANNNKISGKCGTTGYQVFNSWGSARHNALVQTTALITAKHIDGKSDVYSLLADGYRDWSKGQMKYILGDNSITSNGNSSTCFVTGFADNSSKYVHHRAASGYANGESRNDARYHLTNGHVLVGALVGGPNANGEYIDEMTGKDLIYQTNEVALDYNAGLVGAAAGLYSVYGTGTLADSQDDFPKKGGIKSTYLTASTQSLTLSPQQSEKANAIKGIAKVGSDVKAKGVVEYTIDSTNNAELFAAAKNGTNLPSELQGVNITKIVISMDGSRTGVYLNDKAFYSGGTIAGSGAEVSNNVLTLTPQNGNFVSIWDGTIPSNGITTIKLAVWENNFNYAKIYYEPSTPQFTITPSQSTITEGDTLNLTASGNTNTVQWSCDPSGAVAFNSETGNEVTITAQSVTADTTVTITAKDGTDTNAPTATAQITIKPKELTFSIDVTQVRVNGGEKTVTLTATPSDNVRFTRSDGIQVTDNVITVNPTEVGELTITATRGSTSTTQTIEFIGDPFIEGENTMNVGDNQTLKLQNAIGTVTWALQTASDIVTISDTGEVTALKNGTVTVIATDSYDNKTAEFSITVDLFALDVDTSGMEEVDTLTLTKANDWTYTLQNLPITDEQGNAYVYYIEEVLDPATNTLTTPSAVYVPIDYAGNGIQLEENAGTKEMTVTNKLKSSVETTGQMPDAGGEGNGRYYMAGAAMMLAGIAGYFVLKRRQRSRADA